MREANGPAKSKDPYLPFNLSVAHALLRRTTLYKNAHMFLGGAVVYRCDSESRFDTGFTVC